MQMVVTWVGFLALFMCLFVCLFVCLPVFLHVISKTSAAKSLGSPNLTQKCSLMSPGNPFILGSSFLLQAKVQPTSGRQH